jgi:type IV secretory pathway VirB10-like protein
MAADPPRGGLDPTFDVDAAPRVAGNPSLWPVAFGIVGALGLGTVVFLQLNSNRARIEEAKLTDPVPVAAPMSTAGVPPAPDMSQYTQPQQPEPVLIPDPEPEPLQVQAPPPPVAPGQTQAELDRLRAPAMIVDLSQYAAPPAGAPATVGPDGKPLDAAALAAAATASANTGAAIAKNQNETFADRLGVGTSTKPAKAEHMGNLSTTIVQGEIIPAVLETALNSDLPGYARAVVTRDVRGFDGSKILIPRGTRLIGQYSSGVALGQSRAFLIWTRLIRADGVTMELASPATDGLGRGGLTGSVDRHFLQRFGGAILLSLLNIGAGAIADSSDTTVVIAGAQAGSSAMSQAMQGDSDIKPTVKVPQGTPVRVFVSQDLDFTAVGAAPSSVTAAGAGN